MALSQAERKKLSNVHLMPTGSEKFSITLPNKNAEYVRRKAKDCGSNMSKVIQWALDMAETLDAERKHEFVQSQ